MSDYIVTLEGTDELLRNLKRISSDLQGAVALKAVNAGGIQIENRARINAPVKTAALRNSVRTIARMTGNGAEAEIGFRGLVYARIQEFGGTIYARNKPYLVFQYKGKWHKKKSVTIKGKHYLQKSIDEAKTNAVEAMGNVVKSYLGE